MSKVQKVFASVATAGMMIAPLLAAAQVTTITGGSITSVDSLINFMKAILNLLFIIFGILAVLFILWSAILFLTAGSNEDTRKKATAYLKYGIVAIIVAVLSFTIIPLVQSFLAL